ncbi:hypothetical protein, partial [Paraburkholderia phenoliruptrix]|uniref:hypothetical protein n=1 Tax=Paraburkholderia phenoliruptrix TaxID=252970 RepID=UPI0015900534
RNAALTRGIKGNGNTVTSDIAQLSPIGIASHEPARDSIGAAKQAAGPLANRPRSLARRGAAAIPVRRMTRCGIAVGGFYKRSCRQAWAMQFRDARCRRDAAAQAPFPRHGACAPFGTSTSNRGRTRMTTVSDFIVERLAAWGVDRIYGYPGDGIN